MHIIGLSLVSVTLQIKLLSLSSPYTPTNPVRLITCAQFPQCQFLKTVSVFSSRSVTLPYQTVKAIWPSYKALWKHSGKVSDDDSRPSLDTVRCDGSFLTFTENYG